MKESSDARPPRLGMRMPGSPPFRDRTVSFPRALVLLTLSSLVGIPRAGAQVTPVDPEPDTLSPHEAPALASGDSAALVREARAAQARFERRRVHHFPMVWGSSGGQCDEILGRMCLRFGRGSDWEPEPENEAVQEERAELLRTLERIGRDIPGDDWVLGQRIHYLGEADRWEEAERLAVACEGATPWWCAALHGYVLHHKGAYPEAEEAFDRALAAMDPEQAGEWRNPERLLDRDGYQALRGRDGDERRSLEGLVWRLAEPLFLVPGNDRLTAHYARHVASAIQERARNPHNIRWGDDLAEITVRYGTPYGWERERPRRDHMGPPHVLGRHDPRSRGLLPPGRYLEDPARLPPGEWRTDARRVRARYAPEYAPRIHPLEAQVATFHRGDSVLVVATWEVRGSVAYEGADWQPAPDDGYRSGLFLLPMDVADRDADNGRSGERPHREPGREGAMPASIVEGGSRGVLLARAPVGDYVLSLETLHEEEARAWRMRHGLRTAPIDPGVVALSGLLLTRPVGEVGEEEPDGAPDPVFEELALGALARAEIPHGESVGVVWEVYGLVPGERSLRIRLTVERDDRGLLRRAGEWLRLLESDPPVVTEWSEPAPEEGGTLLRSVTLDLGALDPGTYEIRLEVQPGGRTPAVATRSLRIMEDGS